MRTTEEIVSRINEVSESDFFGAQTGDLLECLKFQDAKPFLKDTAEENDWKHIEPTSANIISQMKEYMSFALEKCEDHRGLSASRSIDHFRAWLWLLDDQETLKFIEDGNNYKNYGAPILKFICYKYGFEWRNYETMPIRDWKAALNRFTIQFEDRMPQH